MTAAEDLQQAFHYLYRDEVPALVKLAQRLPPNPVVINIGAGAGTSGLTFMESRGDLTLFTIDIQDVSSPHGCLEGERNACKPAGYVLGERWFQIHNDSKDVGRSWARGPVDMVFIDGDHSYEGATGDINAWMPHIKPGGIIAVHDYDKQLLEHAPDGPHPVVWEEVNRAVLDLLIGRHQEILRVDSLIAFEVW